MDAKNSMRVLEQVLELSKVAQLTTIDENGYPVTRWMTPALIQSREGFLYAVTSARFTKVQQVQANPKVSWTVQDKSLARIISVTGTMLVIDNPALKSEVVEAIGPHLTVFWRLNKRPEDLVVLETAIFEISILDAMNQHSEKVRVGK